MVEHVCPVTACLSIVVVSDHFKKVHLRIFADPSCYAECCRRGVLQKQVSTRKIMLQGTQYRESLSKRNVRDSVNDSDSDFDPQSDDSGGELEKIQLERSQNAVGSALLYTIWYKGDKKPEKAESNAKIKLRRCSSVWTYEQLLRLPLQRHYAKRKRASLGYSFERGTSMQKSSIPPLAIQLRSFDITIYMPR